MSGLRWRRLGLWAFLIGLTMMAALLGRELWPAARSAGAPPARDAATLAQGAYLARLGNCAACHTARGGVPLAGGRPLATPFGTVYSSNLTPDPATGLGAWNSEDFWQALHHGRSRDGRLLSPAFPYTAFTQITRADSDALFAHLMSQPAQHQATPAAELHFPANTALALAAWRLLFFREGAAGPVDPTPQARGAYLVRGLGHCSACHAPRNALGAEADEMSGSMVPGEPWWAPALSLQGADAAEVRHTIDLLKTGQSAHGSALGPMAEVVVRSTQHWRDEDLQAAVAYLQTLPPAPVLPRATRPAAPATLALGARLYERHCADCHGAQGEGRLGQVPPLAGNPTVLQARVSNLVQSLRWGGFAPPTATHPRPYGMPPFDFSAEEQAALLTLIRQSWGNQAPEVGVTDLR